MLHKARSTACRHLVSVQVLHLTLDNCARSHTQQQQLVAAGVGIASAMATQTAAAVQCLHATWVQASGAWCHVHNSTVSVTCKSCTRCHAARCSAGCAAALPMLFPAQACSSMQHCAAAAASSTCRMSVSRVKRLRTACPDVHTALQEHRANTPQGTASADAAALTGCSQPHHKRRFYC